MTHESGGTGLDFMPLRKIAMDAPTGSDRQLLHELQVHQVELEAQNVELRRTQLELDALRERYFDLYEQAPIGYCTLSVKGLIQQANLTAAILLGVTRGVLIKQPISRFILKADQDVFYLFSKQLIETGEAQSCELRMVKKDGTQFWTSLKARAAQNSDGTRELRIMLSDVTERVHAEQNLRHSRSELRKLANHQQSVREDERKRIARDIHDELGQSLLVLRFDLLRMVARPDLDTTCGERADAALNQLDTTIKAVKAIINDLRPAVLDLGLHAAVEWQVKQFEQRSGIACELYIDHDEFALDDKSATALFRIVQESLTNIICHAQASHVRIEMQRRDNRLFVRIADDGMGLSPGGRKKDNAFGLVGIEERIIALGGTFFIESNPGQGLAIMISIPIDVNAQ